MGFYEEIIPPDFSHLKKKEVTSTVEILCHQDGGRCPHTPVRMVAAAPKGAPRRPQITVFLENPSAHGIWSIAGFSRPDGFRRIFPVDQKRMYGRIIFYQTPPRKILPARGGSIFWRGREGVTLARDPGCFST
jgi:hypothetical protein